MVEGHIYVFHVLVITTIASKRRRGQTVHRQQQGPLYVNGCGHLIPLSPDVALRTARGVVGGGRGGGKVVGMGAWGSGGGGQGGEKVQAGLGRGGGWSGEVGLERTTA